MRGITYFKYSTEDEITSIQNEYKNPRKCQYLRIYIFKNRLIENVKCIF